jgi:hypothetical protein
MFAYLFRSGLRLMVVTVLLNSFFVSSALAGDKKMLWQSREQFVAIEPVEKDAEGKNTHPVTITTENLTTLLAAIDLRDGDTPAAETLFTQESLQNLVPYLQQALQTAGPGDDVTYAVIGLYKSLYGLAKRPKVTTGRLFFRDNKLNMIIGLAQQDVNDRVDRRLEPFTPGSRQKVANGDWKIVPHGGSDFFHLKRKDWIVFNNALGKISPVTSTSTPSPVPTSAPAAVPANPTPTETRNPSERIKVINELKNNGLITDDEYRIKRQQILDSL